MLSAFHDNINELIEKSKYFCVDDWTSNQNVKVPGKQVQLIKQDMYGKLVVLEEGLNILNGIKGNIAILNIVGPYRSGKSYILNLLLNRMDGFLLGSTYESCTKGVWMWDTPIRHRNEHGEFNLILLDTEGLDSPNSQINNKIFVLSILLSSLLVYNTKGVIDRNAIKQLGIMTNLSSYINSNVSINDEDDDTMYFNSPYFVWTVRDFFLDLVGKTPKQYLLSSLEMESLRNGKNKELEDVDFIRESIKKSFKSLDCFCLPLPVENGLNGMSLDDTLKNLDSVDFRDLRRDFQNGIKNLFERIKRDISPKTIHTTPLSASAFSRYVEVVVEQLNNNERVSLTESLTISIKYASEKSLKEAIENYKFKMEIFFEENPMPLKWEILESKENEVMQSCYKNLEKNLTGPAKMNKSVLESFTSELYQYEQVGYEKMLIGGLFFGYRTKNSAMIKAFNKNLLNNSWKKNIGDVYLKKENISDPEIVNNFLFCHQQFERKQSTIK